MSDFVEHKHPDGEDGYDVDDFDVEAAEGDVAVDGETEPVNRKRLFGEMGVEEATALKQEEEQVKEEANEEKEGEENEENEENDENEENEEESEEENENDDEDDDLRSRKRRRANQFVDIEAEVDDEEDEEIDEEDEEAELLREQFLADDKEAPETERQDDRLHREFDRRRQETEDQDAEALAETLKQRYRKTHSVYRGDSATSGTVSQKLLMPSINDPSIYAIRCSPGREKDLVRKLFDKKRTLARTGRPLDILTVFQRDSFKGYIYIEAKRAEAIDRALAGMVNVYPKNRLLVPVREYPDLLKQVKSSDVEIVPGLYVRMTRGKYKGDLAIVDNLSENGLDVRCKLVPRLDYGKNDTFDKDGRRIKLKVRPPARLFSEQEARAYDSEFLSPGRGPRAYVYRGDDYVDGFLYKDFKLQFINTKDVNPTLAELERFNVGDDGIDVSAVALMKKEQTSAFQPGDKVEVRRGEQARTVGKVTALSLNEVTIMVADSGDPRFVNQELTVVAADLRKVFAPGDHVRVVAGKHADETGLVIKLEGDSVVLLSDQTKADVRVFANYLVKATDALTSTETGGMYDIKDLVQLNASTVGVIVKADKDLYELLTSDGRLTTVKPSGIASKLRLTRREQIATDKNGNTVQVGDTVREIATDKKREGVVVHIFKNALFIQLHDVSENLGFFVTNCMNVLAVTRDGPKGPDLTKMNPNKVAGPSSVVTARRGGRDKLIYKDVIVTGGNHKGLMGKVTDTDDVFARIELHTKSKKIKVNKNNLSVIIRGESIPYLRFIGANTGPQNSGPSMNNQNRFGPAFSSGGKSAWGNGGATPMVGGGGAGGGTSWGGGATSWGKTPGGASTWGGNANAGASTWGGGNGAASTWGSGANAGASTWGNANGGASTWGSNGNAGTSTWGNNGAGSTWGGAGAGAGGGAGAGAGSAWGSGSNSTWGNRGGDKSTWGSGSTWGNK